MCGCACLVFSAREPLKPRFRYWMDINEFSSFTIFHVDLLSSGSVIDF